LYYDQIFLRLMEIYEWTSIYIILDKNSASFYPFIARVIEEPFQKRKILVTKLVYSSERQRLDYDQTLAEFSGKSRGKKEILCVH
jgi:hypothetical protein